jgi:branched-chain amino acid transport system substrate-binding protein
MRYLPHYLITVLLVLALVACANAKPETSSPTEIKVESQISPKEVTVFQDAANIVIDSDPVVDVIRVGLIIDEENLMAAYDRQPGVAFVGAIEELNRKGGLLGKPIELLRINSESRLSVIDTAAKKLIEAGVQLIVVTCELDYATPAIKRAKEAEVLIISPCASEEDWGLGEVDTLAFSMTTRPKVYGAELADYLWGQEDRSVAIFWDDTSPETIQECLAFRDSWRNLGGWSTVESAINMVTAPSVIGPADRNKTLDVDVIVTCASQRVGILTLQLIRGAGWLTPIVAGPSLDSASFFPSDVSGLGDFRMVSFASTEGDDPYTAVNQAAEYFENVDGILPASGRFILGADLADLWTLAVELAGTADSRVVAQTIKSFESIEVSSGTIEFEGTQAVTKRVLRMVRHVDGIMVFETLMG